MPVHPRIRRSVAIRRSPRCRVRGILPILVIIVSRMLVCCAHIVCGRSPKPVPDGSFEVHWCEGWQDGVLQSKICLSIGAGLTEVRCMEIDVGSDNLKDGVELMLLESLVVLTNITSAVSSQMGLQFEVSRSLHFLYCCAAFLL